MTEPQKTITVEQIADLIEEHANDHQKETGCTNAEREQFLKNLTAEFEKRMFPDKKQC